MGVTRLGELTKAHVDHIHDIGIKSTAVHLRKKHFSGKTRMLYCQWELMKVERKVLGRSRKVLKRLYAIEFAARQERLAPLREKLEHSR